ncbi:ABC-2 transporter permease, partial [Ruminococcus sp. AM27-16]
MKGLFVKDIELMKQQKQFFILVIVMGVILNLAGSGSISFATGYFTFVTAIFAITTI